MPMPNFKKEPWKHPAVWNAHVVKMTRDYPNGVVVSVATCECGWSVCSRVFERRGPDYLARDDAVHEHWLGVIAEAEAVSA